jgi:hypothetical protein
MTSDLNTLIHSYIDAWNETDAERRRHPVERIWTEDGSFGPDAHNDRLRFAWRLLGQDGGAPVAAGADFARVAEDGR